MAVLNKYADANITGNVVDKLLSALKSGTSTLYAFAQTYEVAAADDDGSIIRMGKSLDPNLIPLFLFVANDALTAGTDWDLGLYKPDLGVAISAGATNCFADAMDLSSAHKLGLAALSGLSNVDQAAVGKRLYEHAGHTVTTKLEAYDLALTANTIGSAAGTVTVVGIFAQG